MDQPCECRLISSYERPKIPSDLLPDQTPGISSPLQAYCLRVWSDSPDVFLVGASLWLIVYSSFKIQGCGKSPILGVTEYLKR